MVFCDERAPLNAAAYNRHLFLIPERFLLMKKKFSITGLKNKARAFKIWP